MTVKIKGLDAIVKKLDGLGKPGVFKPPMVKSVGHLFKIMTSNPRKAPGAFTKWATDGQRAAYWAKVAENPGIHGPQGYRRSGRLLGDWQRKISDGGRRGEVSNRNTGGYAQWVQGVRQQPFHKETEYSRTDKVAEKEASKIAEFFKRAYDKELAK